MAEESKAAPNAAPDANFEANRLKVRVVTPEHIVVDTDATAVVLPGQAGVMEVLPGAAPLMTAIGAGLLVVRGGGEGDQTFVVARGFAEVLPDRVTVLAEYAEAPDAVDKGAAEQLLQDGQKAMQEAGQDPSRYRNARQMVVEAEAKLGKSGA